MISWAREGSYSISDLEETFVTLMHYGIKLNPAKCIFGVKRGKFLALRIDSRVTNNEAEYEAVLAGIQAAREIRASRIILYSDSQLITQQIKGFYEAKDDKMLKYLKLIKAQKESFVDWSIEQILRDENGEADALAKMAVSLSEVNTREVLHVTRLILSTDEEILPAPEDSWMTPLIKFIIHSELPEDKTQAQKIKIQIFMKDVVGEHLGGIALVRKAMISGFWWPSINQDSARVVRACDGCQHHSNFQHNPATLMKLIWASCPFDQWGMDIVGPFPTARAQKKFLLVAVDYFSKWGKEITSWCQKMKITQSFTYVAYPQANDQTEVVNRIIVQGLKTRLQGKGKDWVEELPSVLWAYRTTPREPTQETPFSLVYGSEAVLPVEIGQSSAQIESYPDDNDQSRAMELDLVEEKRERAMIRMEAYHGRITKSYNKRV
ncbi:uncharacterized protein [Primulina huaijiensis]|uniref:uncharacterized protein n=1 Tax=Primulina huaijiensis TaxID=1492673 RepID=UPI003CC77226